MDLSNLTIPPDLFYSKAPDEIWKPKRMKNITPAEITKNFIFNSCKKQAKHRTTKPKAPMLGRIGKLSAKRSKLLKKILKKKSQGRALQEKTGNIIPDNSGQLIQKEVKKDDPKRTLLAKLTTQQEERELRKAIKEKEEAIKKRMFSDENFSRKRLKGSSFKFFKTKNDREDDESSQSDQSDDLVPEIRDYSETLSSLSSLVVTAEVHKVPIESVIDETAFEDEEDDAEPDIVGTTIAIESLLKDLDQVDDLNEIEQQETSTLDELIGTLEGPTADKTTDKPVPKQAAQKQKFMGLGSNQLQIDAGQKKFGLVECKDCRFSYNVS